MSTLAHEPASVNAYLDSDAPLEAGLPLDAPDAEALAAYVDWLIATDDPGHATEPTPVEALGPAPAAPWWESAGHDPELDDVRYEPTDEALEWERMLDAIAEGFVHESDPVTDLDQPYYRHV